MERDRRPNVLDAEPHGRLLRAPRGDRASREALPRGDAGRPDASTAFRFNLSLLLDRHGRVAEALELAEKAVEIVPGDARLPRLARHPLGPRGS